MEFKRLPRFKRVSDLPPIEITRRDRDIIRQIHWHRFLRSSHLANLIGGSHQQLLRRLQLLYHHGYLERPRCQLDYYHRGGSRPIVYGLGNKGALLLSREYGMRLSTLRWGEKNRKVGRVYLEHALAVSEFMVALELACRERSDVKLISSDTLLAEAGRVTFSWRVKVFGKVSLGVIPDAGFALESKGSRAYYFLEADRGTMPVVRRNLAQTSMWRKLLAYQATWSQGIHQKELGFHRFRVLTVTSSPERLQSLLNACADLRIGKGLFLFTDRETLQKHPNVLDLPWHAGSGGTDVLISPATLSLFREAA